MQGLKLNMLLRLFVAISLLAPPVYAGGNGIFIGADMTSQHTDNARKQSEEKKADFISERQDIYVLGMKAIYQNDWVHVDSSYRANRLAFSEESQPNYSFLEGNSELTLGSNYYPLSLLVQQSSNSFINSPDALNLTSNREERSILLVQPALKWRLGGVDAIQSNVSSTKVDYKKNNEKNSTSDGAELAWLHDFTRVDTLSLAIQENETEFMYRPLMDYRYESINALYSVNLHHLKYAVGIGGNRSIKKEDDQAYSRPNYNVKVAFDSGANVFTLTASELITNSSMSNGSGMSEVQGDIGSLDTGVDIIDQRSIQATWSFKNLCERCESSISVGNIRSDFQTLNQDSLNQNARASFSYLISRRSSMAFTLSNSNRKFDSDSHMASFAQRMEELSYNYKIVKELNLTAFIMKNERSSERIGYGYTENILGLHLSYQFN